MKIIRNITLILVLIFITIMVLLFIGCGKKEAQGEGCPSGSYVANEGDTITAPSAFTLTLPACSSGGSQLFTPVTFSVFDKDGNARNNVCLAVYTDGFYWTDQFYNIEHVGEGPADKITVATDANGRATLYWSTEILPNANPVVGTTAGADQAGQSFVKVYSGVLTAEYDVNWTVPGCKP